MQRNCWVLLVWILVLSPLVLAKDRTLAENRVIVDDSDLSVLFKQNQVEGSLLITSLNGDIQYAYNSALFEQRFIPASTFKIPNTLISLNEGIIENIDQLIKWDGKKYRLKPWNRDQTLTTAFSISCVWCYQRFAEKIGNEKYLEALKTLEYGNQKTGPNLTTFWLDGELAVSIMDQIQFLKRLYQHDLPFKTEHIQILKDIMIVEKTANFILRAKTGWAARVKPQHGWYVGYIEVKNQVWFFANFIRINTRADLKLRQKIVLEGLKRKGIID